MSVLGAIGSFLNFVPSGVFIKYVVEFPDLGITVSNDVVAASLTRDADITVKMAQDTQGTTFTVVIYDLPFDILKKLKQASHQDGVASRAVKIQLGYRETQVGLVVQGVFDKVSTAIGDKGLGQDKLVATITGKENALFACTNTKYGGVSLSKDKATSYPDLAKALLALIADSKNTKATPGIDGLVKTVTSDAKTSVAADTDVVLQGDTILAAMSDLAKKAKQEMLVVDGTVTLTSFPQSTPTGQATPLDPDANLARIEDIVVKPKKEDQDGSDSPAAQPPTPSPSPPASTPTPAPAKASPPASPTQCFTFTVLGNPTLRPGQPVSVNSVDGFAGKTYVIRNVDHKFDSSAGYTCVGGASSPPQNSGEASAFDAGIKQDAAGAAQAVADAVKTAAGNAVEVVQVKQTQKAYRADLYHAAAPPDFVPQPSIEAEIKQDEKKIYQNKPISSAFAWRKCGLVTPVYPGMKALMAHNLGLATDGIVTGYIWSDKPDTPPPAYHDGDWWLSLPIDLPATPTAAPGATASPSAKTTPGAANGADSATSKPNPPDDTKVVHDLISASGLRVIAVKGLRITVGASKLGNLGVRPDDAQTDDFLIEHASGTKLHIGGDGALTIEAGSAKMTIKGDVVIQGTLEIK